MLGSLVTANTRAVWNTGLLRVLTRLRYQVSSISIIKGQGSLMRILISGSRVSGDAGAAHQ